MRLELLPPLASEPVEGEIKRDIGAVVARSATRGVVLELGPADGAPHLRLVLTADETQRLIATLQTIANGGGEAIMMSDE